MAEPATPQMRRRPPTIERWEPAFAPALEAALADTPGRVAWAEGRRPARFFPALAERLLPCSPALLDTPAAEAAPVLAGLRQAGAAFLLVDRTHPRVAPWAEPAAHTLRPRLRDGGAVPGLAPVVLGSGWALHRLTPPLPDAAEAGRLLAHARAVLAGEPPEAADTPHTVTLSLHPAGGGRRLAARTAAGVTAAARALRAAWPEIRAAAQAARGLSLAEELRAEVPRLGLGLQIHHPPCLLADRTTEALAWTLVPGLHGLAAEAGAIDPLRAVEDGIAHPVLLLETLVKETGQERFLRPARHPAVARTRPLVLAEAAWSAASDAPFWRTAADAWMAPDAAGPALRLHRGLPLVPAAAVTPQALRHALLLGARRLMADQGPDGGIRPVHRPGALARHAVLPLALLAVHERLGDPAVLEAARSALAHGLSRRAEMDRRAAALTLLALLALPAGADAAAWQDAADALAAALDAPAETPAEDPEGEHADTAGLVLLARARLAARDGGPARHASALDAVLAAGAAWQDRAAARTDDGIHAEPDRIALTAGAPWLARAAAVLHEATGDAAVARLGLAVQDWVADTLLLTPARTPGPEALGALFKRHGEAPSVTSCRGVTTAAAALHLARRTGRETAAEEEALHLGVRFCLQLQVDGPGTTWWADHPARLRGGFRFSLGQPHVRADWTGRALLALAEADAVLFPQAEAEAGARLPQPPAAALAPEAG